MTPGVLISGDLKYYLGLLMKENVRLMASGSGHMTALEMGFIIKAIARPEVVNEWEALLRAISEKSSHESAAGCP